ncbi:hypothetical protein QZH41_014170 [Actinostola sp. cb2023]|nr:hypothetical protein QZH41_014170 [Actinostola sp. cb2023]
MEVERSEELDKEPVKVDENDVKSQTIGWQSLLTFTVLFLAWLGGFASRLFAVIRFESIIHEFDPWFNYRATHHLANHGFYNFLNWFDERAWYPLGRIVGGTVYPGLMVTSAGIHSILNTLNITVHIRDVCVFLAPVFSGLTAIATYLLTKELWNDRAGLLAACFIAIVPGYISRSVAGSYDNEGIAIFALQFTYYLWVKSVKTGSVFWAICTSLSYFYMVSAWGGYVFIINLIPLHIFFLLIMGRFTQRIYVVFPQNIASKEINHTYEEWYIKSDRKKKSVKQATAKSKNEKTKKNSMISKIIYFPQPGSKRQRTNKRQESTEEDEDGSILGSNLKGIVVMCIVMMLMMFAVHCTWVTSNAYSSPSVVLASTNYDGSRSILDDFREAYFWLRQNTDDDARVMSWWDYGYQIAGMANRTTLVDNNTWNNSHIALVGKAMSSNETAAYKIMRMLEVDYILVIFGGVIGYSGDDINKFLWMVRIAEGEHPGEIKESDYFTPQGEFRVDAAGSPILLNCLMYKMCYHRFGEMQLDFRSPSGFDRTRNVEIGNKNVKLEHIEEAFTSEHWLVRIYKVKDLANRVKSGRPKRLTNIKPSRYIPRKTSSKGYIKNKLRVVQGKRPAKKGKKKTKKAKRT